MQTTPKYNLNIVEGNDIVNPLVQFNPNFQKIDETMYKNETAAVGTATEIKSGSVHAITRVNTEVTTFKFVATSDYVAGETFTLDGVQVTAYTTDGSPLATNAYRIGAVVLVSVSDTVMYFYTATVGTTTAENAEKLNGQPADYYRTAEALNAVRDTATSAGTLASQAATKKITRTELWSNPNPTSSFADQTITITAGYDYIEAYFAVPTSNEIIEIKLTPTSDTRFTVQYVTVLNGSTWKVYSRSVKAYGGNKVVFYDAYNTGATDNNVLIPLKIFGYKLG